MTWLCVAKLVAFIRTWPRGDNRPPSCYSLKKPDWVERQFRLEEQLDVVQEENITGYGA